MEKPLISNTVNRLEKELRKVNNELKNIQDLEQTLSSIYDSLSEIEKSVADEEINQIFDQKLKEKRMLETVNKVSSNLAALKKVLAEKEMQDLQLREFIENYRNSRTYMFHSENTAIEFLKQVFSLSMLNQFTFRPKFVGTININEIAQELKLKKDSPTSLTVERKKLERLIKHLMKKKIRGDFHLDSPAIKTHWKKPNTIQVQASNQKIKTLDRICRMLNGSFE